MKRLVEFNRHPVVLIILLVALVVGIYTTLQAVAEQQGIRNTVSMDLCQLENTSEPRGLVRVQSDLSVCGRASQQLRDDPAASLVWERADGTPVETVPLAWDTEVGADGLVSFRATPERLSMYTPGRYVVFFVVGRQVADQFEFAIEP
jgi:hypothetical protein